MKEYTSDSPVFSESINITEPSDPAHADNVNAAPMQLLQNTLHNWMDIRTLGAITGYLERVYGAEVTMPGLVTSDGRSFVTGQGKAYRAVRAQPCGNKGSVLEEIGRLNDTVARQGEGILGITQMLMTGTVETGLTTMDGRHFATASGVRFRAHMETDIGEIRQEMHENGEQARQMQTGIDENSYQIGELKNEVYKNFGQIMEELSALNKKVEEMLAKKYFVPFI